MTEWYVRGPDGNVVGPVSEGTLRRGIETGRIPAEALIRRVGEREWGPLAGFGERAGREDSGPARSAQRAMALYAGLGLAAIGTAVGAFAIGRATAPSASSGTAALPAPSGSAGADAVRQCASNDSCTLFGKQGTCIGGVCVLDGPHCSRDADCDDHEPCTDQRCDEGSCFISEASGVCTADSDGDGLCLHGYCERSGSGTCADGDCSAPANPCRAAFCESGSCSSQPAADGTECVRQTGIPGTCTAGRCTSDDIDLLPHKECKFALPAQLPCPARPYEGLAEVLIER